MAGAGHVAVSWRRSAKAQPASTKFRVPATDAPNVLGRARSRPGSGRRRSTATPIFRPCGAPSTRGASGALRLRSRSGRVDRRRGWLIEARQSGAPEGAHLSGRAAGPLAKAADVVLPGAAWVEKDGYLHQRPGPSSRPRRRRWSTAGRGGRGLADPDQRGGGARSALHAMRAPPQVRADLAAASASHAGLRRARRPDLQSPGSAETLAPGVQSDRALEVGRDVPGSAAGEGA